MNEQQARVVRKLKVDQKCPYPTVARKFYSEFGDTKYCNKSNAECIMYFDLDNASDGVKVHKFKNGPLKIKDYREVEYLFSPDTGKNLCLAACSFFNEDPGDGWLDFVQEHNYEQSS